MSPEQLKKLKSLSDLFENGAAGHSQVQQLSELLASANQNKEDANSPFENIQNGIPTSSPFMS